MTSLPRTGAEAAAPMSRGRAALALALLLGLQPVATDAYLPSLPALTRDLGATMAAAQMTMAGLILAFGIAQLVWGPVADRWGRRPVLLFGTALFALAGVGSMLAGSIGVLVAWRVLQGVALAAAVVCARAMLRDLYEPNEGARVMSVALSGLALLAIASPTIGGLIATGGGWRAALGLVALCGVLVFGHVAWRVPETLRERRPSAMHWHALARTWAEIARHPVFVAWTLLIACGYGGLFTILAASSFTYIDVLGFSAAAYGLTMGTGAFAYLLGTFACRRWVARLGMIGAVQRAAFLTLTAGLATLAAAAAGRPPAWALIAPQYLFAFAHGVHQPCGQAGVTGPFPQAAGTAAALAGFVLAAIAFAVGQWLGIAIDGTVAPMAHGLAFWSACTATVAWTLVRRLGRA